MTMDDEACYRAFRAHDARFDGRVFAGVTSTGIYCRPVCRVRTPKRANMRFFSCAAAAEAAGFRPCLRCRPELAPGYAEVDASARLACATAVALERTLSEAPEETLPAIAGRLGVSDRHLRRTFRRHFGVTPMAYLQTARLLMAKRLLRDTHLTVTAVAYASGFTSLRRMNASFRDRYHLVPSALRGPGHAPPAGAPADAGLRLFLPYRPPYAFNRLLAFLRARAIRGVEQVTHDTYARAVRVQRRGAEHCGWFRVAHAPARHALELLVSSSLAPDLGATIQTVARMFDLSSEPLEIAEALRDVRGFEVGTRLPGTVDVFEACVRALFEGRATCREILDRLHDELAPAHPELAGGAVTRAFLTPSVLANAAPEVLQRAFVSEAQARLLRDVAARFAEGSLSSASTAPQFVREFGAIAGVKKWMVDLALVRGFGWPDASPARGWGLAPIHLRHLSPWQSYAALADGIPHPDQGP
jgi:AraC family transcriptional regulator of adaptative response / DNA-3-methyladenine glycosylase II